MQIARIFTKDGETDPAAAEKGSLPADCRLRTFHDPERGIYIVPAHWPAAAVDVLIDRVFCHRPLPPRPEPRPEAGMAAWLWPASPATPAPQAAAQDSDNEEAAGERDIRQVLHRVAGALAYAGRVAGVLTRDADAAAFYDECRVMLFRQVAMFDVALLQSAGLDWAYGFEPVPYIPSARLSSLGMAQNLGRALPLGTVSIPVDAPEPRMLKRLDIIAESHAIDAGDDTAALEISLPIEHVDSRAFIARQHGGEITAMATALGRRVLRQALARVMDTVDRTSVFGFDPAHNSRLAAAVLAAQKAGVADTVIERAIDYARQGYEDIPPDAFAENVHTPHAPADDLPKAPFRGILSVPDDFIETALTGHGIMMIDAGKGVYHAAAPALWQKLAEAIWASGGIDVFFRDRARTHFLPDAGRLGSAGGLVFLPDAAAPAATLNLAALMPPTAGEKTPLIDTALTDHAVRLLTVALDCALSLLPPQKKTMAYRPVCIGHTGAAALLMSQGIAYDSAPGRQAVAAITAFIGGSAALASAEIADVAGAFDAYAAGAKDYLADIKTFMARLNASYGALTLPGRTGAVFNPALVPDQALVESARMLWEKAYAMGKNNGFRHSHLTGIAADAATGTLLGADVAGLAPVPQLVSFGAGVDDAGTPSLFFGKRLFDAAARGLKRLGYTARQIDEIYAYAAGHGTLFDAPAINHASLAARGFTEAMLQSVEQAITSAQHIRYAFSPWTLGDDYIEAQGIDPDGDILGQLGFSEDDIDAAHIHACGMMTIEGAPHVLPEHLPVFDTALRGGGIRCVSPQAVISMHGAVEQFLSGTAAGTVLLEHTATIDDIEKLLLAGWEAGVKRLSLYRQGTSLFSPLARPLGAVAADNTDTETIHERKHAL